MSELRDKFESIIEDAADGLHDSTLWWDEDFADNGTTIITNLCKRLEDAAREVIPELPPVCPEDLVEGEWYVIKRGEKMEIAKYENRWLNGVSCTVGPRVPDAIYGPLKFRIRGAE